MKNKKKSVTVFVILIAVFLFIILAVTGIFYFLTQPVEKKSDDVENIRIEVTFGTYVKTVSQILKENNLIKSNLIFYICARKPDLLKIFYPEYDLSDSFTLKSGIYHLNKNMNTADFLKILSSGQQEYIKIAIPEGYTISKIGELLEQNQVCELQDFKNSTINPELLKKYNIITKSCEGFLFPDTYYFNPHMNSDEVVELMLENFFKKVSTLTDINSISADELTDYVILASIIEREYRIADEAPVIASVFYNRLNNNIGLYSCATIEYILTEIQGKPHPDRILIEDTKINSPYNTYKWAGLPPGAISNPGMVALNAAIHPAKTNYYFFQVVDEEKGKHVFTESFNKHISNHNLSLKK